MAGDWIKVEVALPLKPEVWQIAGMTGLDADAVVGKLIRAWAWFDAHTENGNAVGVTFALLDSVCGRNGFAEAMALVGWLEQDGSIMRLPNFDRHNGKTAKNRALTAKRVASHKTKSNAEGNAASVSCALPREEKRREDAKQDQKPSADKPPRKSKRQQAEDAALPTWIDRNTWKAWIAVRTKPDAGIAANIRKLDEWRSQGYDPNAILFEAAASGWQGLFLPSSLRNQNAPAYGNQHRQSLVERVAANAQRIIAAERAANGIDDGDAMASHGADLRAPLDGTAWRVP